MLLDIFFPRRNHRKFRAKKKLLLVFWIEIHNQRHHQNSHAWGSYHTHEQASLLSQSVLFYQGLSYPLLYPKQEEVNYIFSSLILYFILPFYIVADEVKTKTLLWKINCHLHYQINPLKNLYLYWFLPHPEKAKGLRI